MLLVKLSQQRLMVASPAAGKPEIQFYNRCPVLANNPALAKRACRRSSVRLERATSRLPPVSAVDEFAEFAKVAPGFFFSFGTQKLGTISGGNHAKNHQATETPILCRFMQFTRPRSRPSQVQTIPRRRQEPETENRESSTFI